MIQFPRAAHGCWEWLLQFQGIAAPSPKPQAGQAAREAGKALAHDLSLQVNHWDAVQDAQAR